MPQLRPIVHLDAENLVPSVTVGPIPSWMPLHALLGEGGWREEQTPQGRYAHAELPHAQAADVGARLRGLGFGGRAVEVRVHPRLSRPLVRAARLRDARARRDTSPGFSRRGVRLDDDGRRYLTPEALALEIGHLARGRSVLDLTAGAGGNAIGFARAGSRVIATELDEERLKLARHNARVYGVQDQITFRHGDAREVIAQESAEIVFVDPPWGVYDKVRVTLSDLPLLAELMPALSYKEQVWLKLPPSFDPDTLAREAELRPLFGVAPGDRHRVKLLLAICSEPARPGIIPE